MRSQSLTKLWRNTVSDIGTVHHSVDGSLVEELDETKSMLAGYNKKSGVDEKKYNNGRQLGLYPTLKKICCRLTGLVYEVTMLCLANLKTKKVQVTGQVNQLFVKK